MSLLLRAATLVDGTTADVRIEGERIAAVDVALEPEAGDELVDLGGRLLCPAFVEPHAHLDKAFLADRYDNPTGDLMGAIEVMESIRGLITIDDTIERAERAVRLMVSNGATAVRTHADLTVQNGLRSVEALLQVRESMRGICDVQVVCLTGWSVLDESAPEQIELVREAMSMGVDVLGGCPHLDTDPARATDVLMTLAAEGGLPVDLHTDETLNPAVLGLEDLAKWVTSTGFPHGVSASHCVSLGVQPADVQAVVAEQVAAAGISVITLPHTNLFLQGRQHPSCQPRGLTALPALRAAGVNVAAGADNLQDPFNLVGKGDPLETAALMVMAGHYLPADAFVACTAAGRRALGLEPVEVVVGAPAELVAIPAADVRRAIANQPGGRLTVHRGRVVAGE
jgi:cytosine deaminase